MMLLILAGVLFVLISAVGHSMFVLSGRESERERQRKVMQEAYGVPCRLCGVVETAHTWITGHAWSV